MNRTQRITSDWLLHSGLEGNELLLEALLRRGFLAYRDNSGVWLGTGSHPKDSKVLGLIGDLEVVPIIGHQDRMARVTILHANVSVMNVASNIVAIPVCHFDEGDLLPPEILGKTWVSYRNMVWGTKVAICHQWPGHNVLDLGVALLVKALPLARVATGFYSCDGHGHNPASICFHFPWDSQWGKAVFNILGTHTPHSTWAWSPTGLSITPQGEDTDLAMLGMLNDIQHFSRQLLSQTTIDKIGRARARTLKTFGTYGPNIEDFAKEARRQLADEFYSISQSP